jgi:alkylation response protein AidB-like acyl-CoA dehydrogenase
MLLTDDQRAIRDLSAQFAKTEMLPFAAAWDRDHFFPVDTLKKAAELGFAGINAREQWGGSALSRQEGVLIYEQLATACPSTTAYLSVHNMVVWLIDTFANDTLAEKWLPLLTRMELFGSYCLTEPNAGSDAASLTTSAIADGDDFIVNGQKVFISGAGASDLYVTMVRTGEPGPKGISCLLIEKNSEGLHFGELEKKLGWHSQPTRMVFFDKVRVPKQNLIGELGQGFKIALSALNGGRINIAACSLGGAQACLDLAMNYTQERKQFGKAIADFQNTQFKIADMATELAAARLLVYQAAERLDHKDPEAAMYAAMAKRFATDTGFTICNQALQLFGGYGYLQDYPIERYLRDLRVHQILEGTNEIMRLIIARQLLAVR